MNPSLVSLGRLNDSCQRRTRKLRVRLGNIRSESSEKRDALVSSTIVDAAWLWTTFLRAHYLSSCFGTRTVSGIHVRTTLNLKSLDLALRHAITHYKNQPFTRSTVTWSDEPAWFNVHKYQTLYATLATSNLSAVNSAFTYQSLFFESLQRSRNFYAHRGPDTARKALLLARQVGLPSVRGLHLTDVLCHQVPGASVQIITDWLYDIEFVVDQLCA